MLPLLLVLADDPQPGPIRNFGDWEVACDNTHACEMTSLYPGDDPAPEEGSEFDASASVTRAAGPEGGFGVTIELVGDASEAVTARVDGAALASGRLERGAVRFTGADAARIVAAMANGKELSLTGAGGKALARVSLKGSSASLRFIDAEQGRVGGVTAAVAKGNAPASAVPAAPEPPRVAAVRPSGAPARVTKTMRLAMEKASDCTDLYEEGGDFPPPPVYEYALGGGKTLALLPCGSGAYNDSTVPFILSGGTFALARFDFSPGEVDSDEIAFLVNADWHDKAGTLSSYAKGRGIGDCGNSEEYVWDGERFRLIAARRMEECRGSINWLPVWRATPAR